MMPESQGGAGVAGRIVARVRDVAAAARAADVRIGLGYTAVRLDDGRTGVAYTFRHRAEGCCTIWNGGALSGAGAAELLPLLESPDPIEAAVGLACANALANTDRPELAGGDMLEQLGLRADDDVAMIGDFGPMLVPIRERARSLTVVEEAGDASGASRPADDASEVLRRSQVAIVTATALINHTADGLLEAARECREVALLGASTPLLAAAFEGLNVTMLSGVVVREPAGVLRVVSEGGGARQLGPYVRKVNLRLARGPRER